MARVRRDRVLSIAQTDGTFERQSIRGQTIWVGKCIHCRSKLAVSEMGDLLGNASVEHIVPKHHGGDDTVKNLALACRRCNSQKGVRKDNLAKAEPGRLALEALLLERRRARWREPQ